MTIYCPPRTITLVLLASLLAAACTKDHSSPTQPRPPSDPSGPPAATVTKILIKVPNSIAPGQSVPLLATALNSDGTTKDVTADAQWSSADSSTVQVEPDGRVTGLKVGETAITAVYQSATGTLYGHSSVIVLVPGTHKLSGHVTDQGVGIANATVAVVDPSGADLRTLTAADGAYALYGVAGRVQLRASREGYATAVEEFDVTGTTTRNVAMTIDRPRLDLSGTYSLIIRLGTCDARAEGTFETDFANRRYTATVTQTGPQLAVSLSGADFITRNGAGNHFSGSVDPIGQVKFEIGNPDDVYAVEYPDLVERLSATSAFLVYGTVKAQATATTLIGTIAGPIVIAPVNNPSFGARSAWCYSDGHAFEMRRQ